MNWLAIYRYPSKHQAVLAAHSCVYNFAHVVVFTHVATHIRVTNMLYRIKAVRVVR